MNRFEWIGLPISIHAPLTGSDVRYIGSGLGVENFNPRSPHRERRIIYRLDEIERNFNPRSPHRERQSLYALFYVVCQFQSTLPSQGATHKRSDRDSDRKFQSTLPSQGATPMPPAYSIQILDFNPRSPHRERRVWRRESMLLSKFQSTLPSQGATANIHIKFLCDLLFSTLSSKNSFTLSRFPQTIT